MLALLLFILINPAVMAVEEDRDDADVDFDLGYAILLGGLFVLLVYQLIPRPRRKISYEEQEDIEEQEKINDPVPHDNAEADKDPDEAPLHSKYGQELSTMIALVAMRSTNMMGILDCPGAIWEIPLAEFTNQLKGAIATKATTLAHLDSVCRQLTEEFSTSLVSFMSAKLRKWKPTGVVSDALPTDELLRTLIASELSRKGMTWLGDAVGDMCDDARIERYTYQWAEAAAAEEGGLRGWQQTVEEHFSDIGEAVIDELSKACSAADKPGPAGPTQAQRDMINAFAKSVLSELRLG
ncbi:unnamed protein product, partial [Mesorhabditis spiculigera]